MIDTAVVLAAGKGTRLGKVTHTRSKAMVPVAGEPMIARVMGELAQAGIGRFFVIGAPSDAELRQFCRKRGDVTILEQNEPRGSGDALMVCRDRVSGSFVVSACDSLIPARDIQALCQLHSEQSARVTVGVLGVTPDTPLTARSVVKIEGNRVVDLIEKPTPEQRISDVTCLPLYVCTEDIFESLAALEPSERGEYELPRVFSKLARDGSGVFAQFISDRIDLTDQRDLLTINLEFLEHLDKHVKIDRSARISPSATVIGPSLIGPGCVVEDGASVGPLAYLEANVTVEKDTLVTRAVVLRGTRVRDNAQDKVLL